MVVGNGKRPLECTGGDPGESSVRATGLYLEQPCPIRPCYIRRQLKIYMAWLNESSGNEPSFRLLIIIKDVTSW